MRLLFFGNFEHTHTPPYLPSSVQDREKLERWKYAMCVSVFAWVHEWVVV